jgi:hypothetical protein
LFLLPSVLASPIAFFFGRRLMKQAQAEHRGESAPAGHSAPHETTSSVVRHDGSHRAHT